MYYHLFLDTASCSSMRLAFFWSVGLGFHSVRLSGVSRGVFDRGHFFIDLAYWGWGLLTGNGRTLC